MTKQQRIDAVFKVVMLLLAAIVTLLGSCIERSVNKMVDTVDDHGIRLTRLESTKLANAATRDDLKDVKDDLKERIVKCEAQNEAQWRRIGELARGE